MRNKGSKKTQIRLDSFGYIGRRKGQQSSVGLPTLQYNYRCGEIDDIGNNK
jgi:hypothetical protein